MSPTKPPFARPLTYDKKRGIVDAENWQVAITLGNHKRGAYLVTAVNEHEGLVDALKELLLASGRYFGGLGKPIEEIRHNTDRLIAASEAAAALFARLRPQPNPATRAK